MSNIITVKHLLLRTHLTHRQIIGMMGKSSKFPYSISPKVEQPDLT
ncbi:MAG: hypothetical protein ACYDA4_10995 [Ignavibacteriaceae bacterium]